MAKRRNGKKSPRSRKTQIELPKAEPSTLAKLARALFRPSVLLTFATVALAFVALPILSRSLPDPKQRSEYVTDHSAIKINEPPHWVPRDLVEQVLDQAQFPKQLSLLDDDLTRKIAIAFDRHPWVADVVHVQKSVPARIDVELEYRRPVAMVQVEAGMYPIDPKGILLPPSDFSVAESESYPLITDVKSSPRGSAGTPWGDPSILGAARIADALSTHWRDFDLKEIRRIRRTPEDATETTFYELGTVGGSRILWGRAPGDDHPGELTVKQKIGRLQRYHSDFGGFDEPHGPYEIDIRHWQEISRRPLTAGEFRSLR
jgi:hypothetical protein